MITFPATLAEAIGGAGVVRAGGTDLGDLRHRGVLTGDLVDLRDTTGLDGIEARDGALHVGAGVRLADLATHPAVMARYRGLTEATGGLATPQIRAVATVGGNLLQHVRCWYFRHPELRCLRRGGSACLARAGDHLFHVCFDTHSCAAPHPSTVAVAALAFDAEVVIDGEHPRPLLDLYRGAPMAAVHALKPGEVLSALVLPDPWPGEQSAWVRTIARARAEWPLVEAVARIRVEAGTITDARVVLGGVAPLPLRLPAVEAALRGKAPSRDAFATAAALGRDGGAPMPMTAYKLDLIPPTLEDVLERAIAAAPVPSGPETPAPPPAGEPG